MSKRSSAETPSAKPTARKNPLARRVFGARTPKADRRVRYMTSDGKTLPVLRPLRAIRSKCRDCCGGQVVEVRRCQIIDCPLWPYRMGRRPRPADVEKGGDDA